MRQKLQASFNATIIGDWPIAIQSVGQDGTVTVDLPFSSDPSMYNRPASLTAIFIAGLPAAGLTVDRALAANPSGSVDVTPQAALQTTDTIVAIPVADVVPGKYTVWVVGNYPS